jgi:purine-binding chemotaxis protein CheW
MMMNNLYLIARIADTRVALRSDVIESVVTVGDIVAVPGAPRHVAGLFALRSRVLTLIDPHVVLGMTPTAVAAGQRVIVIEIGGHGYALLADRIEDVCFIEGGEAPARGRLADGWAGLADSVVAHDGASLLVVDPARFVTMPMAQRAA